MSLDAWELARWDAVETRERLARREISAEEVVEAALTRARDTATLGAIVTLTPELARAAAARAASAPLGGVPSLVKDLSQVAGVRTTWGTAASGHYVSSKSDPFVRSFEATGLISLGKSATPELGLTATTEPIAFGPARNPWDPGRSTGGSSGGAAAMVAAGVVPLAHASDGGGSIRIPAACCGLVGLKPTRGRLDMEGSSLLPVNVAVHGVVTRTVRDTVAFWAAIERARGARRPIGDVEAAPARRLRVAYFVDAPGARTIHPEVLGAVEATAALCASLGHTVERIACPFDEQSVRDFVDLWSFLAWTEVVAGRLLVHRGFDRRKLEPLTVGFARRFRSRLAAAIAGILRLRGFHRRYAALLAPRDVLLGPTLAELPPPLGQLATDVPFDEALERLLAFTPLTGLINAAGAPAISLPMGRSAGGLPIGVQLAGAHHGERLLLELAGELERARPWPQLAPRPG